MKPLLVLLVSFVLALVTLMLLTGYYKTALAARIGMSAMLLFTAIGHFAFTTGMVMMVPEIVPFKKMVVYLTGIFEIIVAACLLIEFTRVLTGYILVVFLVLMLPANINAAVKKVDFQKADHNGEGLAYLWFRLPLQIFFIAWTYFAAIKP